MAKPPKNGVRKVRFLTEVDFRSDSLWNSMREINLILLLISASKVMQISQISRPSPKFLRPYYWSRNRLEIRHQVCQYIYFIFVTWRNNHYIYLLFFRLYTFMRLVKNFQQVMTRKYFSFYSNWPQICSFVHKAIILLPKL